MFDVSRIVPSTRDLFSALMTQRKSLALLPELLPHEDAAREAERLAELDVRAFAVRDAEGTLMAIARATASTPSLCLTPCGTIEHCQRARFHGADGVRLAASSSDEWLSLSKAAQSMHMMALATAHDVASATAASEWGARALVVEADADTVTQVARAVPAPKLLVAIVSDLDAAPLDTWKGQIDALAVPASVHTPASFADLLDRLDA